MKRILLIAMALAVFLPTVAEAKHPPAFKNYLMEVKRSDGDTFQDCFQFLDNTTLIISGGNLQMAWDHRALGFSKERWQAVLAPPIFGLGFSGTVAWFGTKISGDGINDGGITFVFHGHKVSSCPMGGGPYRYEY